MTYNRKHVEQTQTAMDDKSSRTFEKKLSMTSSPLEPPPQLKLPIKPLDSRILNVSNNTSSSSTASLVLQRSTAPPDMHEPALSSGHRSSSSSFSSSSSQRVRIKAKYLRQVKSPFDQDEDESRDKFVPPALPDNLPAGYKEIQETADAVKRGGSSKRFEINRDAVSYEGDALQKVTSQRVHIGAKENLNPKSSAMLKQGAPTSSQHLPLQTTDGLSSDVRITQFAPGGKQKVFKEHLLKRQENCGPVKRFVRPTMVGGDVASKPNQPPRATTDYKPGDEVCNPHTVAAVTAAAVAATVPIVKAQTDLESKLDAMMERLTQLQELTNKDNLPPAQLQQQQPTAASSSQVDDPQGQLAIDKAIDKRLQMLEKLQEKQLQWQERLLMTSQHPQQQLAGLQPYRSGESSSALNPSGNVHVSMQNGVRGGITDQKSHLLPGQHSELPTGPQDKQHLSTRETQKAHHVAVLHDTDNLVDVQPSKGQDIVGVKLHRAGSQKSKRHTRFTPAVTLHSYPSEDDAQPMRISRTGGHSSDNDNTSKKGKQSSPLDTPAPRRHAPQPLTQNTPPKMPRADKGRGLLKEILSSHDAEQKITTRGRHTYSAATHETNSDVRSPQSGAETKAAGLVQQLSKLKRDMKEMKTDLLKNLHSDITTDRIAAQTKKSPHKRGNSSLHEEAEREWEKLMQRRLQPAPVDIYLRKSPSVPVAIPSPTPHPKQPLSPSQYNAPIHPSLCAEAKAVLDRVQSSRACLEANLDAVIRAKEQEEFYNYLDSLYLEGEAAEKAQLRYKVSRIIAELDEEIKREVRKPKKLHPSDHIPERDTTEGPGAGRSTRVAGKKRPISAKIDSGLRKGQPSMVQERDEGKHKNISQAKKQPVSRAKKPHPVDHNNDEAYLTRVYGKALYQAKRSTIQKEPYLKYAASSPRPKAMRIPPAAQVKGTKMKSTKIQTEPSTRTIPIPNPTSQYYFDPYPIVTPSTHPQTASKQPQAYQPLPTAAPSHGQLIPMAIPLAPPQVGGLAEPVTIETDGLAEGVVRDLDRREVRTNVAVVDIRAEDMEKKRPKLTVQHLPPVDIDTELSSTASSMTELDEIPKGGTRDGRTKITPPDDEELPGQFSHYLAVADISQQEPESEDELPAPGISLPGHYTETQQPYHGPPFPPQAPPPSDQMRPGPSSERIADDIRKDILEDAAMEWIEQELMARMISELYSRQPAVQQRPISPSSMETSSANDSIVETIGPAGLQLFVNAGQAVDQTLVSALVREVLEEKVTTALGQHDRDVPRQQPTLAPMETAAEISVARSPIPTPEVTPKASPVQTPPLGVSRVVTPVASLSEASPVESETESVKELVSVQNVTAGDEPIAAPPSPVTTPINTPPRTPPPDIPTPVLSPRESPKLISVVDGSVLTPMPTPGPASPEPEPEESVVPPSPEQVIEEGPLPPTPTPSLSTTTTPTPSPSSATTTHPTTTTETEGQTISEGEWLISVKSEGQVEDSTEDEPGAVALLAVSPASSIDSTLMGAEDIEKDIQETELSEGEISPVKPAGRLHNQDPVVALLAHMRQRPDPSAPTHQTLNDTPSWGEVSVGQQPALTPSSERLLFEEAYGTKPPPRMSSRQDDPSLRKGIGKVDADTQPSRDSTMTMSHLGREKMALTGREMEKKVRHPVPRIIQVVGKSLSPEPSGKEAQNDHESGDESGSISEGTIEDAEENKQEPRAPIPLNLLGPHTMSDYGTRTLTPDALNIDALLQSGYLSQTFSQSEGGTSDFESTKPPVAASATPLHATQTMTEDSLEHPDKMDIGTKAGVGGRSFIVTLPSAADLSQTISEGELPAVDLTSDISELSGGPLDDEDT